jgi:manganese/zinc/iron transport system substrate-binding protein
MQIILDNDYHYHYHSFIGTRKRCAMNVLGKAIGMACFSAASLSSVPVFGQVEVLATVGMVADIADELGAECTSVSALIGAGIDPHDYQPAASDVRRLQGAELILHVGFGLEGRLGTILDRLAETRPVIAVAEAAVDPDALLFEGEGIVDPHLWMDVGLWARTVPVIADALAGLAPDCADDIAQRAAGYAAKLDALDTWVGASLASVPEGQRVLVTAHDAFSYFARAYGFDMAEGIEGISTESEASIADIRAVAETVVRLRVPAVFVETTVNPRTIEALVAEVRALGHDVEIGGELYSDALGAAGTPEGTYIGMIRANTQTVADALGGAILPLPPELAGWATRWGLEN